MLIVPELKAVFIFPPRTGSDTLCVELMGQFPNAFILYRHAEADLLPVGYEAWRKVGFVRHPLARLWSLWKFCCALEDMQVFEHMQADVARVAASVRGKSFEQWVLTNEEPFLPAGLDPIFTQAHRFPETRKSQRDYLRPDLGTVVLKFQDLGKHMEAWGLNPERRNGATVSVGPKPSLSKRLQKHMKQHFSWELEMELELV